MLFTCLYLNILVVFIITGNLIVFLSYNWRLGINYDFLCPSDLDLTTLSTRSWNYKCHPYITSTRNQYFCMNLNPSTILSYENHIKQFITDKIKIINISITHYQIKYTLIYLCIETAKIWPKIIWILSFNKYWRFGESSRVIDFQVLFVTYIWKVLHKNLRRNHFQWLMYIPGYVRFTLKYVWNDATKILNYRWKLHYLIPWTYWLSKYWKIKYELQSFYLRCWTTAYWKVIYCINLRYSGPRFRKQLIYNDWQEWQIN